VYILGISCFYHDAAAALLTDGEIIAAAQEERFTRKKHDPDFPINAINYCLKEGNITTGDLSHIVFYDKPFVKFERILFSHLANFPWSLPSFVKAIPPWLKEKLWVRDLIIKKLDYEGEILFTEHHLSHAASAFFASPFSEAAILTVDGVGEWATATYGVGRGTEIEILKEIRFPHSLGLIYSAFTYYLGFKVNSAEYKVMGLAPYGRPRYYDDVMRLIDLKDDGSFKLDMGYFAYDYGLKMISKRFEELFGFPPRKPETPLEERHMDMAASIQKATEEVLLRMVTHLHRKTGLSNLCMAGGVALNCVANGKVLRQSPFSSLFVQPAAGDAGGAVGAAMFLYHSILKKKRGKYWHHPYYGPSFSREEVKSFLDREGVSYLELPEKELIKKTAEFIASGKLVGWFQGRMEFGPRALGNRSILADPRDPDMKEKLNKKVKFREWFRPFAPSVLADDAGDYFDLDVESPFMLVTAMVKRPDDVPAITHIDGSARLQTVSRASNPRYFGLISEFKRITGCPVVLNTSLNVRGEPIVCTPADAYSCFRRTGLDYLVMEDFVVDKKDVPALPYEEWRGKIPLD
jgi:carbamoyltransferase